MIIFCETSIDLHLYVLSRVPHLEDNHEMCADSARSRFQETGEPAVDGMGGRREGSPQTRRQGGICSLRR